MRIAIIAGAGCVLALALGTPVQARPSEPVAFGHGAAPRPADSQAQQMGEVPSLSWPRLQAATRRVAGKPRAIAPVQRAAAGPLGLDTSYTWSIDNFDGSAVLDPLLWVQVSDLNDVGQVHWGEYFWNVSRCRPKSPTQAMWPFGGGVDGSQLGCDVSYPNGVAASAIMLTNPQLQFGGVAPGSLKMAFDVWFNLRDFQEAGVEADGLFVNLIIPPSDGNPEPKRITLLHRTGRFPERYFDEPLEIDFLAAQNVYKPEEIINMFEKGDLLIEFLAVTQRPSEGNPAPTTFPGGMFIDNIRWISDTMPSNTGGTPVATLAPTSAVTNTPVGPSDTPQPTDTAQPTDTPGGSTATTQPTIATPTRRPATATPTQSAPPRRILLPWLSRCGPCSGG